MTGRQLEEWGMWNRWNVGMQLRNAITDYDKYLVCVRVCEQLTIKYYGI